MKDNQRFDPCCSEKDSIRMEAHVLAVDDSLIDRKVIEKLLKTSSCKVTTVDSGRRALQILGLDGEMNQKEKLEEKRLVVEGEEERLKIDLIITDYCMPGMTGYELLKKIKESSVFRETPVVIMSSENIIARIHRCLEEGAEDFIVKPVKLSHVKRLLEHMTATKEDGIKIMRSEEPEPVIINNRNKRKQPDSDFSTSSDSALLSETSPPSTISSASSVSACLSPSKSPPPNSVLKSLDSSSRRVKQDKHLQVAPSATANCSLLPPTPDYNNDTIDELSLV